MTDKKYVMKNNCYGLVCRKKADNKKIRGVTQLNKIASQRSLCTVCTFRKSTFLKQKSESMLTYCLKCKKNPKNVYSKAVKTKDGRPFLLPKNAVCGSKKSRFMKEQEEKRL